MRLVSFQLDDPGGQRVLVNPDHVLYVMELGAGTACTVRMLGDVSLRVQGSLEQVATELREPARGYVRG